MGSDDSIVVLLLVPEVAELVLVSELESLPVDVSADDKPDVDEFGPADEVEEPADVEKSESESIEVEIPSLEVDETSVETEAVIGLEDIVVEPRSVEPNELTEDVVEARSVLAESEEPVGLDESADAVLERLADDEESVSVLNTLDMLVSVELRERKESELVPETVALVETSVGEFDALAVTLEIPDTLSAVDESESTAGWLEDRVAEDEIPLSVELENVEDAELVVKAEVGEEGLELSGEGVLKTLVDVDGGSSAYMSVSVKCLKC